MSRITRPHLRASMPRRVGVVAGITSLLAAGAVGLSAPAQADDSSTLSVVGTSDVFDSNLVQSVIKPGFEAAYKAQTGNDITLNYNSQGTGAAINIARSGAASALIVHAASLENQFVGDGYSAEPYGRAIFFGDYVLLGPQSDPAGVLDAGTPSQDIVSAYEKIAAAGAQHKARFVSRGGTPGTTVQEHAIWKLTSGVDTCTVSAARGGGTSPSTASGDCPTAIPYPSWYKATNANQAANILAGDACNFADSEDPSTNDCYVFTDKGTFQYLRAQNSLSQLKLVAAKNAAAARGGSSLLINNFHAYAINADKFASDPNVKINSAGATAFLNYLTSPAGQTAINNYLATDVDGAPFVQSAAPAFTYTGLPTSLKTGQALILRGTLRNVVPGTPTLSGVKVSILAASTALANTPLTKIGEATTNSRGEFRFDTVPDQTQRYGFSVGPITKIEDATLTPPFGDLLAPASATTTTVAFIGSVTNVKAVNDRTKHAVITGTVNPRTTRTGQAVALYAKKAGSTGGYSSQGRRVLATGTSNFTVAYNLPVGRYSYRIIYINSSGENLGGSGFATLTVRLTHSSAPRRAWLLATLAVVLCAVSAVLGPMEAARADTDGCRAVDDARPSYVCMTFAGQPGRVVEINGDDLFPGGVCSICDVRDDSYETRDTAGRTDQVEGVTGLSIGKLIDTYAPDVQDSVTFTETRLDGPRAANSESLLDGTRDQLRPTGAQPAVYFRDPTRSVNAGYIRPLRGADDENNDESLSTGNNSTVFVHVIVHTTGRVLYPTISETNRVPGKDGTTVGFEADPKATDLAYTWSYGGDAMSGPDDKPSTSYLYTAAGIYRAQVVVTGQDTSYGRSPSIGVQIGEIKTDPTAPVQPGGNDSSGKQTEGPVDGGGTRPGGARTPGDGAGGGTGNATGTPRPTPGAGNGSSGGATGTGAANGTATSSARASAGSGRGDLVQGLALYAPEQAAGAASSRAGQAEAAALRAGSRDDRTDLRWLLWLVPLGLIGLGVFTERRRPRRQGTRT